MTAIRDRVVAATAAVLKVPAEALTDASSPDDVGTWTSMRHLEVILALEEEFGIQLPADAMDSLQTVGGLVRAVSERMG